MPARLAVVAAVMLAAGTARSDESVDLEGARLTPPPRMQRLDEALMRGSVALVPLVAGEAQRRLVGGFAESGEAQADGPATLLVGRVERPLEIDANVRAGASSAIAGHFRGELDLEEVVVDRPTVVAGPPMRLEARAHTRVGRGARTVRFAFVPAGAVHYVLVASLPPDREAELEGPISRAFDSFVPPPSPPAPPPPSLLLRAAAFGAAGVLAALLLKLWRRRRRQESIRG